MIPHVEPFGRTLTKSDLKLHARKTNAFVVSETNQRIMTNNKIPGEKNYRVKEF